jgi:hypothetical protein
MTENQDKDQNDLPQLLLRTTQKFKIPYNDGYLQI